MGSHLAVRPQPCQRPKSALQPAGGFHWPAKTRLNFSLPRSSPGTEDHVQRVDNPREGRLKGGRNVQGLSRRSAAHLDHRFAAAAGVAHRAARQPQLPRSDGQCPLARAVRGCGVDPSARAGGGRARHLHRRRRALRRGDRRVELAELSADPYGRVLARGGADPAGGRRRRAAARA